MHLPQGRRLLALAVIPVVAAGGTAVALRPHTAEAAGQPSATLTTATADNAPVVYSTAVKHTTTRVSLRPNNKQSVSGSKVTAITPNGRYVVFATSGSDSIPDEGYNEDDKVYVRDTKTNKTTLASVAPAGGMGANSSFGHISSNGRYLVWEAENPGANAPEVFFRDLTTKKTTRIADGEQPTISADGSTVAFASQATDLVPNDTNTVEDVFVWSRSSGKITRVSVGSDGHQSDAPPGPIDSAAKDRLSFYPEISGDGKSVAFVSYATNLVPGDTNVESDIFVHNLTTHVTSRVSLNSKNEQAQGNRPGGSNTDMHISANGKVIIFQSNANNLVSPRPTAGEEWYARDLTTGKTQLVEHTLKGKSGANGATNYAGLSPDGRYVAFASKDTNIVAKDTNKKFDVFVRDLKTKTIRRVSVTSKGVQGNGHSSVPVISNGGAAVAFESAATNFVAKDTNQEYDIFLRK